MESRSRAEELHTQARALANDGKDDEAIALYLEAIRLDPEKSESFYNVGLIYKYRGAWRESFKFNHRANQLDPEHEGSRWNLAIAATALRDWETARKAWADQGIKLTGEAGPIEMNFGWAPVRLNPDSRGEVVWATRIDPVRARIDNVPLPESGFRCGDVVLHDGAQTGTRVKGGREYGVFNVLELFQRSEFFTFEASVRAESGNDLEKLEQIFAGADVPLEIWTTNIRQLCRQCSEGKVHEDHDADLTADTGNEYRVGIATKDGNEIEALLARWEAGSGGKVVSTEKHLAQ